MFDIEENLKILPDKPGVYLYKDKYGEIIYVGKAVSLKKRVRQYFRGTDSLPVKVKALVKEIDEFEYIITETEMEALILENNLIKKNMPRFNVLLRDDKTYPYIKVTTGDCFPRVIKTRRVVNDGGKYFGPYTDVGAVNQIIDLINRLYPVKKCSTQRFPKGFRPCLNYHIGLCPGICSLYEGETLAEKVPEKEAFEAVRAASSDADCPETAEGFVKCYSLMVEEILKFLHGGSERTEKLLREKMEAAAEALDFEKAAALRDDLLALEILQEKQKIVTDPKNDIDIIVADEVMEGTNIMLFYVRGGKLLGRESLRVNPAVTESKEEKVAAFIKQYYSDGTLIPKEILVEDDCQEFRLIEEWLSEIKGSQVRISVPKRGDRKALLEMGCENIRKTREAIEKRVRNEEDKTRRLGAALGGIITGDEGRGRPVERIEAYDISNTSGVDSVGVMVVFERGKKRPKDYRKFKIKTIEGPNDYGSLQEVIYRRLSKYIEARDTGKPNGFEKRPDLLLIDGGEKQAAAVEQVVRALKLDIPVAGMVKDDKHRTEDLVYLGERAGLKKSGELYKFIYFIQEEVHRFAIDYHRSLRDKKVSKSVLDTIPGIGEKRRNALLSHFGSVEAIKNASLEDLLEVPGMNRAAAQAVADFF